MNISDPTCPYQLPLASYYNCIYCLVWLSCTA